MKKNLTTSLCLALFGLSIFLPIKTAKAEINSDGGITTELGILGQQTAPVLFLENKGQMIDDQGAQVPQVLFKATANGIDFYLTNRGLTYVFYKVDGEDHAPAALTEPSETDANNAPEPPLPKIAKFRLDMELVGANLNAEVVKENATGFFANYYLAHCPQGITGVKEYQKITLKDIYPNIDWVLYSDRNNELSVKYDFVVHPGGDPSVIRMQYKDADKMIVSPDGTIIVHTPFGSIREGLPVSYQGILSDDGKQQTIPCSYILEGDIIRFSHGEYDKSSSFVIDPPLSWSTYYGGTGNDIAHWVVVDNTDSVIVAGYTNSTNFPVVNAYQTTNAGSDDVFVAKFDNLGVRRWATYYGGTGGDYGLSVDVDPSLNIAVSGNTSSSDFPLQNAHQASNGGGQDAFIIQFNRNGIRQWSSYYGGTNTDYGYSTATDLSGNVYMAGLALSNNNIGTAGSHQQSHSCCNTWEGYLVKFNSSGVRQWGTYYGGTSLDKANGVATDNSGNVFLCGFTRSTNGISTGGAFQTTYNGTQTAGQYDGFLAKFNSAGVRQWGTYYGGSGSEIGTGVGIDLWGNAFLTGRTASGDFPVLNAYQPNLNAGLDAFVVKFNNSGVRQWCTYYGGSANDNTVNETAVTTDQDGNVIVAGITQSTDLVLLDPIQSTYGGGTDDGFVVQFDSIGTFLFATYYGGNVGDGIRGVDVDVNNTIFIVGYTASTTNFTTYDPGGGAYFQSSIAGGNDAFIAKLGLACSINSNFTASAISICPGETVIFTNTTSGATAYEWFENGVSFSTATNPSRTFNTAGTYAISLISDTISCSEKIVNISVSPPASSFAISNVPCTGGTGAVDLTPSGGSPNRALSFDGVDDYVDIPGITWTPTAFSVEFWLYPLSSTNYNQSLGATNGWDSFEFHTTTTGEVYVGTDVATRFTPTDLPAGTVVLNQWQHFVFTFDNGTGNFYKDGVLLANKTGMTNPIAWSGFRISNTGINQPMDGRVDDVRLWDTSITAATVLSNYSTCGPVSSASIIGYWDMNEGTGSVAKDRSGNDYTATLNSGTAWTGPAGVDYGCWSDGTGYSYLWSTADTTQDIINLSIGTYYVTITDANNCVGTDSATVALDEPVLNITGKDVSCTAATDGMVDLGVSGGMPNMALNFDGNDNITVPDNASLDLTNNFTIEAWVNSNATAGIRRIASKSTAYGFGIIGNSQIRFTTYAILDYDLTYALPTGVWYHVAVVFDAANDANFYVNGLAVGTVAGAAPANLSANVLDLGSLGAGSEFFDGQIDDIRIWNTSLSAAQILSNYNSCGPITGANLIGYWDFNEGTGTVANDRSGSGNNGTLSGPTWTGPAGVDYGCWSDGTGYTYLWNTTDITQDLSNLTAITYSVTVTDANGCSSSDSVIISESPPAASITATNVTCNGGDEGAANLTPSGGTPNLAMSFDGVDDYVEVASHTNPTAAITVSCWAKSNSAITSGNNALMSVVCPLSISKSNNPPS